MALILTNVIQDMILNSIQEILVVGWTMLGNVNVQVL